MRAEVTRVLYIWTYPKLTPPLPLVSDWEGRRHEGREGGKEVVREEGRLRRREGGLVAVTVRCIKKTAPGWSLYGRV